MGALRKSSRSLSHLLMSSCQNMVNVSPLTGFATWLRYCTDVAQWMSTKLCTMFGRLLGWYTMYTFLGLLPPDGILRGAKFTLHSSLAFSYVGSVTARHSSSRRQPYFAALYKEWNYGTFTDGFTCTAGQPSRWASANISSFFSST